MSTSPFWFNSDGFNPATGLGEGFIDWGSTRERYTAPGGIGGTYGAGGQSASGNWSSTGDDHRSPGSHTRAGAGAGAAAGSSIGGGGGSTQPVGMTYEEFLAAQRRQNRIAQQNAARTAQMAARQQGQSVYDWARSVFEPVFGSQTSEIMDAVKGTRSMEQAITEIRKTKAYADRFSGNIARQKAGLPMLSESEYLGLERSYRGAMRAAGLPEGFYDDPKDYANFIANDVSAAELEARANLAGDLAVTKNPQLWKELKSRGLTKGDAAAYILNPEKGLPAIERKIARAEMGAAARDAGMDFAKGNKFENKLVGKGVSADAARQAFQYAQDTGQGLNEMASVYGEDGFSDKNLVKQQLGIGGKKTQEEKNRAKGLRSKERAAWSGRAGGAAGAFGSSDF